MVTPITIINEQKDEFVKMSQMKPYDVAIIKTPGNYYGEVIMRTANTSNFEVMSLSYPRPDRYWDISSSHIYDVLIIENAEIIVKF